MGDYSIQGALRNTYHQTVHGAYNGAMAADEVTEPVARALDRFKTIPGLDPNAVKGAGRLIGSINGAKRGFTSSVFQNTRNFFSDLFSLD